MRPDRPVYQPDGVTLYAPNVAEAARRQFVSRPTLYKNAERYRDGWRLLRLPVPVNERERRPPRLCLDCRRPCTGVRCQTCAAFARSGKESTDA